MNRTLALAAVFVGALIVGHYLSAPSPDGGPKSHVTIYLDQPILEEGGAVIVSGLPVPEDEWLAIKADDNPAVADDGNPKKAQVGEHDKLFGAVISSPVTIVEFRYPENGSYTFNFLPAKGARREYGENLKTELVLVGSGSQIPDP